MRRLLAAARRAILISSRTISELLQRATAQGTRSTILRPLQWMTAFLGVILLGALKYQAPPWLIVALFVMLLLPVLALLMAYFFCLFGAVSRGSNPSVNRELLDALRSERFVLEHLAIEKGVRGDSTTGLIHSNDVQSGRLL